MSLLWLNLRSVTLQSMLQSISLSAHYSVTLHVSLSVSVHSIALPSSYLVQSFVLSFFSPSPPQVIPSFMHPLFTNHTVLLPSPVSLSTFSFHLRLSSTLIFPFTFQPGIMQPIFSSYLSQALFIPGSLL